jgi:hypothetical protein
VRVLPIPPSDQHYQTAPPCQHLLQGSSKFLQLLLPPLSRGRHATAPHQVWFADLRYLVKIDGQWLYSILIFDGYSRAIVEAGCFDRQAFSRVVQVFRHAIEQ